MASVLSLPGSNDNHVSTPDSPAVSVTGDIEFRFDFAKASYATDATMLSKRQGFGSEEAYSIRVDGATPKLWWSEDGSVVLDKSSTADFSGMSAYDRIHMAIRFDVDNESSDADLDFYWRNVVTAAANALDSNANWTKLGATVNNGAVTSIFDGDRSLVIGGLRDTGAGYGPYDGNIYRVIVYDGIGGTVVYDPDFTAEAPGTTSFSESSVNAATVTINQSGDPQAEIVEDPSNPWVSAPTGISMGLRIGL